MLNMFRPVATVVINALVFNRPLAAGVVINVSVTVMTIAFVVAIAGQWHV